MKTSIQHVLLRSASARRSRFGEYLAITPRHNHVLVRKYLEDDRKKNYDKVKWPLSMP